MGKDEYPPVPIIIFGLKNNNNINDLIIEKKIIMIEKENLKIFFLIKGDEGMRIKFIF